MSESLSALPKRDSVWRTPSAAFRDSDERELSYKAAVSSNKPLARWIPALYLLTVIKASFHIHPLKTAATILYRLTKNTYAFFKPDKTFSYLLRISCSYSSAKEK